MNNLQHPGELLPFERQLLYDTILEYKPELIFEVGTGTKGSTNTILKAIDEYEDERGFLFSCDPNRWYESTEYFKFWRLSSSQAILQLIQDKLIPDFIFFDGPEDSNVAFNDFKLLNLHLKVGTIFMMHDWETEQRKFDNGISIKASQLRPYLHTLKNWKIIEELSGIEYEESKETVGMVIAKKL